MSKHVLIMVDTSSSMKQQIKNFNLINGLNKFLDNLRKRADCNNIFVSIILFNTDEFYLYRRYPLINIPQLYDSQFIHWAKGCTSLYDIVGKVLTTWINAHDKHYLFIITDGDDNRSEKFEQKEIQEYCNQATEHYGWCITHCGVDASKLASEKVTGIIYNINDLENMLGSLIL